VDVCERTCVHVVASQGLVACLRVRASVGCGASPMECAGRGLGERQAQLCDPRCGRWRTCA